MLDGLWVVIVPWGCCLIFELIERARLRVVLCHVEMSIAQPLLQVRELGCTLLCLIRDLTQDPRQRRHIWREAASTGLYCLYCLYCLSNIRWSLLSLEHSLAERHIAAMGTHPCDRLKTQKAVAGRSGSWGSSKYECSEEIGHMHNLQVTAVSHRLMRNLPFECMRVRPCGMAVAGWGFGLTSYRGMSATS